MKSSLSRLFYKIWNKPSELLNKSTGISDNLNSSTVIDAVDMFKGNTRDNEMKEFIKLSNSVDLRLAKLHEVISVNQVEASSNRFIKRLISSSFSKAGIQCLKEDIEQVIQHLDEEDIQIAVGEWFHKELYQRDLNFVSSISNRINKS